MFAIKTMKKTMSAITLYGKLPFHFHGKFLINLKSLDYCIYPKYSRPCSLPYSPLQTIPFYCLWVCVKLLNITKTCLYNFDPLKPHFYIIKLGFTGVYIIFLISAQRHRLWVLEAVLTSTHNLCFEQKYFLKNSVFIWKISVFGGEMFYIFE